jgi:single-strand DNA-binding protein
MSGTTVTLVGNVTRDPEMRFLNSGVGIATFGVAVSKRRKNEAGQWEDGETEFYDVVAWRELGENVAESITKGQRVVVVGRLSQRSWETDDGQKRSKIEVVADEVGPSLRWATADVARVQRSSGGGGGGWDSNSEPF